MSLLGWKVEWRSSFRGYEGVVVSENDELITVWELNDQECFTWNPKQQFHKRWLPALSEYIKFHERQLEASLKQNIMLQSDVHLKLIELLETVVHSDYRLCKSKETLLALQEQKLKEAQTIEKLGNNILNLKKGPESDDEDEETVSITTEENSYISETDEQEENKLSTPIPSTNLSNHSNDKSRSQKKEESKGIEDEEIEDEPLIPNDDNNDDDDDNEEEEEVEEDNNDDDEEEDEEDEDEDDDSDDDDDDEDDSSSDSSDEEEEDYDEYKVDIKVHIIPTSDIRGFSIYLTEEGSEKMLKKITKDYGTDMKLFYRDDDGDSITILSHDDLIYAYRGYRKLYKRQLLAQQKEQEQQNKSSKKDKELQSSSSSSRKNSNSKPINIEKELKSLKLKLFADYLVTSSSSSNAVNNHNHNNNHNNNNAHFLPPLSSSRRPSTTSALETKQSSDHITPRRRLSQSVALPTLLHNMSSQLTINNDDDEHELEQHEANKQTNSLVHTNTANTLESSTMLLLPQSMIWKKGEILGTGSFGKVYSGMNLSTGEKIAIKEVTIQDPRNKQCKSQIKALQQEIKILSKLNHMNIIKYYGTEYDAQQTTLRIFLELATEGSLKDNLHEFGGSFPEPLIRCYANDILKGLYYLHQQKIIHRDIKPANLLISQHMIKLADFGCSSSLMTGNSIMGTNSEHATVAGTTIYMAPEVMQAGNVEEEPIPSSVVTDGDGDGDIGPVTKYGRKADIWSLGMTLVELATGLPPYKNAAAAIYAVCVSKKFPSFPEHFSPDAHHFLSRCLHYDAYHRADCSELLKHSFLEPQSMNDIRAQTAASFSGTSSYHMTSSLQFVGLPENLPSTYLTDHESKTYTDHTNSNESTMYTTGPVISRFNSFAMTAFDLPAQSQQQQQRQRSRPTSAIRDALLQDDDNNNDNNSLSDSKFMTCRSPSAAVGNGTGNANGTSHSRRNSKSYLLDGDDEDATVNRVVTGNAHYHHHNNNEAVSKSNHHSRSGSRPVSAKYDDTAMSKDMFLYNTSNEFDSDDWKSVKFVDDDED